MLMSKHSPLIALLFLAVPGLSLDLAAAEPARRIVSLAPSVTETLFTLGLGDRVIGVTDFCKYPPEAKKRPKVGGYFNPNYEAIIGLSPDVVVVLAGRDKTEPALKKLGLKTLVVEHRTVEGIIGSITTIGNAFGRRAEAQRIVADIKARLARINKKTGGRARPRVLVSTWRTVGTGRLVDIYAAGADSFFNTILPMAGGQNACRVAASYPKVSVEGVMTMNPRVIIDILAKETQGKHSAETILADWRQATGVEAVRNGRVYLLDDDFALLPGPRFVELVEKLARLIHPEVDWRQP